MTQTPVRIGVAGARGRMGTAVLQALAGRTDMTAAGRFDRVNPPSEGALADCDVVVDFTGPEASVALAELAGRSGRPALVIGSTGWEPAQGRAVAHAAARVPIVKAGNFSVGLNLLIGLVEQAARTLGPEYDIEITEAHHRRKVDAPSGTALMLGEAAASGRGVALADAAVHGRSGVTGPRPQGAIGFSVVRAGGIVGEHAVLLAAEDEIVTLAHSARDRGLFARGALLAAAWVAGKPPGLYDMRDVLGLSRSA
ncbi:MAG TPA: 4-hydroxy-tetrahydrodipicolinate reductase [Caulobacteraceae bacterium]|jgi:4-hydroxy-tetrahydrodipicolinate reductase